jgi:hypothetical protein
MEQKTRLSCRLALSTVIILFTTCLATPAQTKDEEALVERVLRASHLSRINDFEMKPWHLKASFQLYDRNGKPSETGTIEEWWGGLTLSKLRIESPSYTATIIENRDGGFRTQGAGLVPLQIRAIENNVVYPMPMGEDLKGTTPNLSHLKRDKASLDCIQLEDPPIPPSSMPTFCLAPNSDVLRAIYSSNSRRLLRNRLEVFQGHFAALSITTEEGKLKTSEVEVTELTEIPLSDNLFTPSADMKRVTDMHTGKVTTVR